MAAGESADTENAEAIVPVRVTFDTNAHDKVARPERFPRDPEQPMYYQVHEAVKAGLVEGYFSETLITLEGIQKNQRARVLGSTRIESSSSSSGPRNVSLTLAVRQDRTPLHPEHSRRIQAALAIGMRGLRGPPRVGSARAADPDGKLFLPDASHAALCERIDKAVAIGNAISARDVGMTVAQKLGLRFSARDRAHELWHRGLGRARHIHEERNVQRAVGEWADGDSIASHYAYGIDLFCSGDFGKSAGGPSILSAENRAWLTGRFGVRFVSLSELAAMIRK